MATPDWPSNERTQNNSYFAVSYVLKYLLSIISHLKNSPLIPVFYFSFDPVPFFPFLTYLPERVVHGCNLPCLTSHSLLNPLQTDSHVVPLPKLLSLKSITISLLLNTTKDLYWSLTSLTFLLKDGSKSVVSPELIWAHIYMSGSLHVNVRHPHLGVILSRVLHKYLLNKEHSPNLFFVLI